MSNTLDNAQHAIDGLADRAAQQANQAISATQRSADQALGALKDGVDKLHDDVPDALSRAAAQLDALTRRSIERARQASIDVRHTVDRAGDRTVHYIQDQPVKSMLMAAAAGAALVALAGLLARPKGGNRS